MNKMFHYIVAVKGGKCKVEELAKGLNINEELIPEFVMKRGSERMKFIKADDPRKVKTLIFRCRRISSSRVLADPGWCVPSVPLGSISFIFM